MEGGETMESASPRHTPVLHTQVSPPACAQTALAQFKFTGHPDKGRKHMELILTQTSLVFSPLALRAFNSALW